MKLEMELDEVKDAYRALESSMSREDQQYKQRALLLEKNIEQLNNMYQNAINEKSIIKIDLGLAEKKCKRKDEKIIELEKIVSELREKNKKYETIVKFLREEFIRVEKQAKELQNEQQSNSRVSVVER